MGNARFEELIKKFPEINEVFLAFRKCYSSEKELEESIFRKCSNRGEYQSHVLPAIGHFRVNEAFAGNGEVFFLLLLTTTGSRDDMWSAEITFKFNPGDEIKFTEPSNFRYSMIVEN